MPRLIRRIGHAPALPPPPENVWPGFRILSGYKVYCGDRDLREVYVLHGINCDAAGSPHEDADTLREQFFSSPYDARTGQMQVGYGEIDNCFSGRYPERLPDKVREACYDILHDAQEYVTCQILFPPMTGDLQPSARVDVRRPIDPPALGRIEDHPDVSALPPNTVICEGCGRLSYEHVRHPRCCPDNSFHRLDTQRGRIAVRQFRRHQQIRSDVCVACDALETNDFGRSCRFGMSSPRNRTSCTMHTSLAYRRERRS
jgi:hypothetical protein